jgi:hypothetical protein
MAFRCQCEAPVNGGILGISYTGESCFLYGQKD